MTAKEKADQDEFPSSLLPRLGNSFRPSFFLSFPYSDLFSAEMGMVIIVASDYIFTPFFAFVKKIATY